jgi:hypothetical protein
MTRTKRVWAIGLALCFSLMASKVSAAYLVIENISQNAPNWGDCNCIPATGWVSSVYLPFLVSNTDGTVDSLCVVSSDWYTKAQLKTIRGSVFFLDVSKTSQVSPGGTYTSKKIIGLPDAGFTFVSRSPDVGLHYCSPGVDACGGYSTGATNLSNDLFVTPGLAGSDSFEFQVPAAGQIYWSVVRVTFYPGNPPSRRR